MKTTISKIYWANVGETSALYLTNDAASRNWPLSVKIWDRVNKVGLESGLILVDVCFRACLSTSLLQSRPGTTIVFNDYQGRLRAFLDS